MKGTYNDCLKLELKKKKAINKIMGKSTYMGKPS